jgi:hypothetical protein
MYKFFIFIFFTCLFFQEEQTITWHQDLKLEWSDFKGEPKPVGDAVATTASGISFGFSATRSSNGLEDYSFSIIADFYPDKSWHVKEPLSNIVLNHERLHFDITELYARKFRQRITNFNFTNAINNEMQSIHDTIIKELGELQDKYDDETNHSQILEKQLAWQKFITSELNKLSNYN